MRRVALALGLLACVGLSARADEKTDLFGKYTLVTAKRDGKNLDDRLKKAKFTIAAYKPNKDEPKKEFDGVFTIAGGEVKFVIGYKLDTTAAPVALDMEFMDGPEGTKGSKAYGIVELKDGTLKLAYSLDKTKRPKTFDGKTDFYMELKKEK
ncbi:MAG: TIGR03067 domain-containing protein [Planctomycetia bacterium]|nr:TIGR03067 domain-containing protein [Planctomycetia bacterium]